MKKMLLIVGVLCIILLALVACSSNSEEGGAASYGGVPTAVANVPEVSEEEPVERSPDSFGLAIQGYGLLMLPEREIYVGSFVQSVSLSSKITDGLELGRRE